MLELAEGAEKGFEELEADAVVEKGFLGAATLPAGFTPNRLSPNCVDRGVLFGATCGSGFTSASAGLLPAVLNDLTPLMARILPSFRRHVFLRHVKTYNRLSWPGKCSGRSPFSCKSSTM